MTGLCLRDSRFPTQFADRAPILGIRGDFLLPLALVGDHRPFPFSRLTSHRFTSASRKLSPNCRSTLLCILPYHRSSLPFLVDYGFRGKSEKKKSQTFFLVFFAQLLTLDVRAILVRIPNGAHRIPRGPILSACGTIFIAPVHSLLQSCPPPRHELLVFPPYLYAFLLNFPLQRSNFFSI